MATCPNCGNETSEGAVFCDRCGTRLPEAEAPATPPPASAEPAGGTIICPACGAGNVPGEAFCDYCGSPLEAPAPMAVPPAAAEPAGEAAAAAEQPAAPAAELAAPAEQAAPAEMAAPAELAVEEPGPAAEAPAVPEEPAVAEAPVAEDAANVCPACGAAVLPNEAFCANCGASLAQAPIPPEPVPEAEAVAPPEEEVAPPPAPAPAPSAPAGVNCPACGAEIEPGDAFCSTCGFALQELAAPAVPAPQPAAPAVAPAPAPVPAAAPAAAQAGAAGARLVVSASGAEIPLPAGEEILIGREDPVSGIYPEVDLTPHGGEEGGVSRRHARIVVENGEYYIEDLDSTNLTFVNKQKLAPRTRQRIVEGDEIRTGRVAMVFYT